MMTRSFREEVAMRLFAALVFVSAAFITPAHAEDRSGFFLGAAGGAADLNETLGEIDLGDLDVQVEVDDVAPAWSAFAGYQLNRHFGFRGGYVDFQTFDDILDEADIENLPDLDLDLEGWMLGADAYLPLGRWVSLTGRAGFMSWESKIDFGLPGIEDSDSGTDPFYGAGLEFNLGRHVGMEASYTRFDVDGNDVDFAAAALRIRF